MTIKKAAGQLEDTFMQTAPLEQISIPTLHTTGNKKYVTHLKELLNSKGGKGTVLPPSDKMKSNKQED